MTRKRFRDMTDDERDSETARRIGYYAKRGWCPLPWSHHPKPIRDAIRECRFQPMIKQCFANSQRLLVYAQQLGLLPGLAYCEGYITRMIPMPHGWLLWEGQRIDLTLDYRDDEIEYHGFDTYDYATVRGHLRERRAWGIINEQRLHSHNPMQELMERLRRTG